MAEKMSLQQVRDWAAKTPANNGWKAKERDEAVAAIEAHLAQPAQAVDVATIRSARALIDDVVHGEVDMQQGLSEAHDKLTRALSGEKAGPVGGWQPIETAPINETVFCYHPMVGRFPGYQSRIDGTSAVTWHNTWSQESGVMPPTHWQPLPTSPAPDKEG